MRFLRYGQITALPRTIGCLGLTAVVLLGLVGCRIGGNGGSGNGKPSATTGGAKGGVGLIDRSGSQGGNPTNSAGPGKSPGGAPLIEHSATTAQFVLPSQNIGCYMGDGMARCDIMNRTWQPPARPSTCPEDMEFGQGIEVSPGSADFVCAGDTVLGSTEVLEYGHSMRTASLVCESRESGVLCREDRTGFGFSLSRDGYELFTR